MNLLSHPSLASSTFSPLPPLQELPSLIDSLNRIATLLNQPTFNLSIPLDLTPPTLENRATEYFILSLIKLALYGLNGLCPPDLIALPPLLLEIGCNLNRPINEMSPIPFKKMSLIQTLCATPSSYPVFQALFQYISSDFKKYEPLCNLNLADENGLTPLHIAAQNNNRDAIELLLQYPNLNLYPFCKKITTPLDNPLVLDLLRGYQRFNPNHKINGRPLLVIACEKNLRNLARALVNHPKIDINQPDDCLPHEPQITPLIEACYQSNDALVQLLLSHSHIQINKRDNQGATALFRAAFCGAIDCVRHLLSRAEIEVNTPRKDGITPLIIAIKNLHQGLALLLLQHPFIDINITSRNDSSALSTALELDLNPIAASILRHPQSDPNQITELHSTSFLLKAIQQDQSDLISLFLQHPRFDFQTIDAKNLLNFAISQNRMNPFKVLLDESRIDINFANPEQNTALWSACHVGNLTACQLLLQNPRLDPNKPGQNKTNPLTIACIQKHHRIAQLLLQDPRTHVELFSNGFKKLDLYTIKSIFIHPKLSIRQKKLNETAIRKLQDEDKKNLLKRFNANRTHCQQELRLELGVSHYQSANLFALTVFLCDDYLIIDPMMMGQEFKNYRRFFQIAKRLPIELQMLLCNRTYGVKEDLITGARRETAFKAIVAANGW